MAGKYNLRIDNAVLTFKNFEGKVKNGVGGKRRFAVYLDGYNYKGQTFDNEEDIPRYKYGPNILAPNDLIPVLQKDGWNVKFWPKQPIELDNGTIREPRPYLEVNVKLYPEDDPRAKFSSQLDVARADGGITSYDEENAYVFDTMWIKKANLMIRPYEYKKREGIENGPVSAELARLFVIPVEDRWDDDEDFYEGYER